MTAIIQHTSNDNFKYLSEYSNDNFEYSDECFQIVDSIMALFRVDFSGRGELSERQQKLGQMMSRLQKISEEYNIVVFLTNQMTADPGATLSFQVSF